MGAVVRAFVVPALLALAACVGDVQGGGGSSSGSGSGSGGADAAIDAPKLMWVDAASGSGTNLPCENATTPNGDGHHYAGMDCLNGCHDHGFTLAGTLFTNATGNQPVPGATITIVDSNNQTIDLVTASNGNFYTRQALAFPVLTMASQCPSAVKMNAAVAASGRGCNGCHVVGLSQIHLP